MWRRSKGPLTALLLLLVFAFGYSVLNAGQQYGALDPRSTQPKGSRAIARLLTAQGVSVEVSTTTDSTMRLARGRAATVFVAEPNLLDPYQLAALRTAGAARIVLVAPGTAALSALAPGVAPAPAAGPAAASPEGTTGALAGEPVTDRQPSCGLPAALRAGTVQLGGAGYGPGSSSAAELCYPSDDGSYALARTDRTQGDTIVLGSASLLENDRLAQQGNASLGLQLLGSRPELIWYLPSLGDGTAPAATRQRTFLQLLPAGWRWGLIQAAVAAVLAALWRARRLGPLVAERLPVVVRASETAEGHARLYHRAKATARAAEVLREAARHRLAPLVGCAAESAPESFTVAVASRLPATGPPVVHPADALATAPGADFGTVPSTPDVHRLLFGPAPADDAGLVRLADQLDALERLVHHP